MPAQPGMTSKRLRHAAIAALLLVLVGASASASTSVAETASLHLNQVQVLGSHNSYRPYPSPQTQARILANDPQDWPALAYGNPPLESQLALGLHQLEIDVSADPNGGLYADPYKHNQAPQALLTQMLLPGAKVLHIPGLDVDSHCRTFPECLAIFARWSDHHPGHDPIMILVNSVDQSAVKGLWPHHSAFDRASLDALDADIAHIIGRARVITPDEVRGDHATLREAVLAGAWPTLAKARGRFLFVLDGSPEHERIYRQDHPALKGRMMFGWYDEQTPEAAVFSIPNALEEQARIQRLVGMGFIVRTRADEDGVEARAHDDRRLRAAIASGAQWISTDYYPGVPDPQGLGYTVDLDGSTSRCDQVAGHCPPSTPPSSR